MVYAVVSNGGRQHRVAVGDLVDIDLVAGDAGSALRLPALLLVDGDHVVADAELLADVAVNAEIVEAVKGPKIHILRFKNKTGYRRRQGHRQKYTRVRVTDISA